MEKSEKLMAISHAYTTKKVEDAREEITIISEDLTPEASEAIKSIQFKLNDETGTFELDYDIMSSACDILANEELENIKSEDVFDNIDEWGASVYTATRLGYLNMNNQDEISDIAKEYGCDIQTACAVWYDRQVETAARMLREWILAD